MSRPASVSELHEKAEAIVEQAPVLHQHSSLATALVAALADLTVVEKNRTVTVAHKGGGQHSYEYADIADVVKLTRPVLSNHGIVALTPVHDHGDGLACTVTLLHTSGERLDLGPFPFPRGHDAQATGSMVTYHRRYALIAALGMAAGDDDDGAAASKPAPRREPEPVQHPDAVTLLVELADLAEVGDKLRTQLVERAGAVSAAAALQDEGWRNWLRQAIEHHRRNLESDASNPSSPVEAQTLPLDGGE